jgi:hypothetical protein
VRESDGTITVVLLFCGAGGLLLLMHPDNAASTTSEASIIFMLNPLTSLNRSNARPACGYRRRIGFVPARYPASVTSYSRVTVLLEPYDECALNNSAHSLLRLLRIGPISGI